MSDLLWPFAWRLASTVDSLDPWTWIQVTEVLAIRSMFCGKRRHSSDRGTTAVLHCQKVPSYINSLRKAMVLYALGIYVLYIGYGGHKSLYGLIWVELRHAL